MERVRRVTAVEHDLAAGEAAPARCRDEVPKLGLGQASKEIAAEDLVTGHGTKCDGRDTRCVTAATQRERRVEPGRPGGIESPNQEEADVMGRNRSRIRVRLWLAVAVAVASLGVVSSASAQLYMGDVYGTTAAPAPVAVAAPDEGFNWGDALVGAGVALGAACAGGAAVVFVSRNRRTGLAA